MGLRKISILAVVLSLCALAAQAKTKDVPEGIPLTAEQLTLVRKSIAREKIAIQEIRKHAPLVQTYVQDFRSNPGLNGTPTSDEYMISRVDFGKVFQADAYGSRTDRNGFFRGSAKAFAMLTRLLRVTYSRDGFMDMMFIDPSGYDLEHYDFSFVRREFLGNVRTAVFDVRPKPGAGSGRFFGRIWVEDQDGNVVRFNGTYNRGPYEREDHAWAHFDSWRANIEPGVWLPMAIYVEDDDSGSLQSRGFRAQTFFWGYSLGLPAHVSDNESIKIDNVIDDSQSAQDMSPLQEQREWEAEAAQNVLDRLVQAGLLAPPGAFDKVLDQVTTNLIIGNKLDLAGEVHCRVLLTQPLESASVGNTILLSKGLIDVLPDEADLAAVLSFELAQIVLGHEIDTRYAFNDRLLFPDEATFQRIDMSHSLQDDAASAREAIQLLDHSVYRDKMADVGVFLAELQAQEKNLKALMTPHLGDSLIDPQGTPWLEGVSEVPAKLEPDNLKQIAALPLGSHLKVDPWNDEVSSLRAAPVTILSPSDKMPMQITPIYFRLSRYEPPQASAASDPGPGPASPPQPSANPPAAKPTAPPNGAQQPPEQ